MHRILTQPPQRYSAMLKRQTSSTALPAAKRARVRDQTILHVSNKDRFPTIEEVVHHIFSFLDAKHLCIIQSVCLLHEQLYTTVC